MKIFFIIYAIMFVIVIGTFITTHILFNKFPNSKLTNFWRKHIVTDEDLESL
jgi:hypothetical protein